MTKITSESSLTVMALTLETLPVELVADILSELDLGSLIVVSGLSRRLRAVASDVSEHFSCLML